ncbi:galactinol synthase 2 [Quercus suber]|uniref:Galactinol synthase 2 n=1 Tax=Quercus suber TaxID=58331 RepID=A0AAW0L669_QUESU
MAPNVTVATTITGFTKPVTLPNRAIYQDDVLRWWHSSMRSENIDELFDLPDGHYYSSHHSNKIRYCKQCSEKVQWPDVLGSRPSLYFNAASQPTNDDLLKTMEITMPTTFAEKAKANTIFFFKDFLIFLFRNWIYTSQCLQYKPSFGYDYDNYVAVAALAEDGPLTFSTTPPAA